MSKIFNKDKSLSEYGLACGYIEKYSKGIEEVEVYMEHSHYAVRLLLNNRVVQWETFESGELGKARKLYNSLKKSIRLFPLEEN